MTSPSLQTAPSFSTRQTTTGLGRPLVLALITFVIYFVTGTTEHLATPLGYDGRGTLWWACGWAVALTFIFGKVALPGVFLGELVTAFLIVNGPPWLHFVTATGNTLEAALGAELLRRWGFSGRMTTNRDVRALFVTASIMPLPMLALQTIGYHFAGKITAGEVWFSIFKWLFNDLLAAVFVIPLACILIRPGEILSGWRHRWRELICLVAGMSIDTILAFGTPSGFWFAGLMGFAIIFLVWAAIRFEPRTTVILLAIHSMVIVVCVTLKLDPFPDQSNNSFPYLHLPMLLVSLLAYFLAASVAERQAAERRFRQSARWEGLGALAGGLAHELNNQLTVILGATEMAEEMLPKNSPVRELLRSVTQSGEKMAGMVGNLLAFSGRGITPDSRPTDVVAVVREAVAETSGQVYFENKSGSEFTLLADPTILRLSIRNLIQNALEASPKGTGRVSVTVAPAELAAEDLANTWPVEGAPGSYLIIRVSDNGSGMEPEVAQKMFDPFFTTKFAGRGLGLAVVSGVARQMSGSVRVKTAVGAGTTIDMMLPVNPPEAVPPAEQPTVKLTNTNTETLLA